jgi:hypothetical protein
MTTQLAERRHPAALPEGRSRGPGGLLCEARDVIPARPRPCARHPSAAGAGRSRVRVGPGGQDFGPGWVSGLVVAGEDGHLG